MNKYLSAILCLAILGCAPAREVVQIVKGDPGQNGTSCTVADYYGEPSPEPSPTWSPSPDTLTATPTPAGPKLGAMISCTDGSYSLVLNGETGAQGVQGEQGVAGQNGTSCSVSRSHHSDYATISCPGSSPVRVYDGQDGRNGIGCSVSQMSNGARITCGSGIAFVFNGTNGTNGTSCSVSNDSQGARITCGNTSQLVLDGQTGAPGAVGPTGPQGPQGQPGQNALANAIGIKGYIYPCGVEFNNDEIFLRLTDGKILAVYDGSTTSNPDLSRLALLAPGNYRTTDRTGTQCLLSVDSNLNVSSNPQTTGLRLNN